MCRIKNCKDKIKRVNKVSVYDLLQTFNTTVLPVLIICCKDLLHGIKDKDESYFDRAWWKPLFNPHNKRYMLSLTFVSVLKSHIILAGYSIGTQTWMHLNNVSCCVRSILVNNHIGSILQFIYLNFNDDNLMATLRFNIHQTQSFSFDFWFKSFCSRVWMYVKSGRTEVWKK